MKFKEGLQTSRNTKGYCDYCGKEILDPKDSVLRDEGENGETSCYAW